MSAAGPGEGAAAQESGAAVVVQDASLTYPDGTRALQAVNLSVQPREFVTLLGPSGCGKSTLLKLVAGLLSPSSGRVRRWGQQGVAAADGAARDMAFVFQEPTLMPWRRLRANVRLPLDLAGRERAASDARVDAALALAGLTGFENHFPRQLSGGMQMRASLARALVQEPGLLLMDEPFGALDEITRARLDSDLLELWGRRQLTIIFVTHSVYEAVFLSTRVVVMAARPGRIVHEMAIDEPFPRGDAFRVSAGFLAACQRLSASLADASAERAPAGAA